MRFVDMSLTIINISITVYAGITLRSLGGAFIATLVGLGIAMIVLAFEVYFHKKYQKNAVQNIVVEEVRRGHP